MPAPTLPPATPGAHGGSLADLSRDRIHQQTAEAAASVCMVVCYSRTANAGTAGQRLLGRQRAKLEREAAGHGWWVVAWIEDLHQSGTTLACTTPWRCSPTTRPTRCSPPTSPVWPSRPRSPTSSPRWPTARAGGC